MWRNMAAQICAGCGQCAAACPTGAASLRAAALDALMRKLRAMLTAYREAGGQKPILMLHDGAHGTPMIDALARHGDGLPANVLPITVNEVTQVGTRSDCRGVCLWRSACVSCCVASRDTIRAGLPRPLQWLNRFLSGLGFYGARVAQHRNRRSRSRLGKRYEHRAR